MLNLDACPTHKYCRICYDDYLNEKIGNTGKIKLVCMDSGCDNEFTDKDIRRFASDELYEKYNKFKTNFKVEEDENLKFCSKPGCEKYVES